MIDVLGPILAMAGGLLLGVLITKLDPRSWKYTRGIWRRREQDEEE